MAEWRRGVRNKVVLANKATCGGRGASPAPEEAKSGFVSGRVRTARRAPWRRMSGAAQLKRNGNALTLLCFVANRHASAERQKET